MRAHMGLTRVIKSRVKLCHAMHEPDSEPDPDTETLSEAETEQPLMHLNCPRCAHEYTMYYPYGFCLMGPYSTRNDEEDVLDAFADDPAVLQAFEDAMRAIRVLNVACRERLVAMNPNARPDERDASAWPGVFYINDASHQDWPTADAPALWPESHAGDAARGAAGERGVADRAHAAEA